jgi:hypothetical protein
MGGDGHESSSCSGDAECFLIGCNLMKSDATWSGFMPLSGDAFALLLCGYPFIFLPTTDSVTLWTEGLCFNGVLVFYIFCFLISFFSVFIITGVFFSEVVLTVL